jgi:hypothetical protein
MTSRKRRTSETHGRPHLAGLQPPGLGGAAGSGTGPKQCRGHKPLAGTGNFQDLENLLDNLWAAPVFELGKPLPNERFMPQRPVGSCPAAHNRALLDAAD